MRKAYFRNRAIFIYFKIRLIFPTYLTLIGSLFYLSTFRHKNENSCKNISGKLFWLRNLPIKLIHIKTISSSWTMNLFYWRFNNYCLNKCLIKNELFLLVTRFLKKFQNISKEAENFLRYEIRKFEPKFFFSSDEKLLKFRLWGIALIS